MARMSGIAKVAAADDELCKGIGEDGTPGGKHADPPAVSQPVSNSPSALPPTTSPKMSPKSGWSREWLASFWEADTSRG